MQYALLLAGDEALEPTPGTPAFDELLAGFARFDELLGDRFITGEALLPAMTATTIRSVDGAPSATDGPFAEATEVVGGLYVIEAADLDTAIELARHLPVAAYGAVEIRPVARLADLGAVEEPSEERCAGAEPSAPDAVDEVTARVAFLWRDETVEPDPTSESFAAALAAHQAFQTGHAEVLRAGVGLRPASTATTIRVRGGEVLVTDGPYAETTEVIGGFYSLAPMPLAAAVEVAGAIPCEPEGAVELRPVMAFG